MGPTISTGKPYLLACLLVLAGALSYANSLTGPFLFDDQSAILANPQIRQLWPPIDALTAPATSALAGRPTATLSFALSYAIGGLDVRGYHIGNIALHILSGLILFGIIRLTLSEERLRRRFVSAADGLVFTCVLVWLVHPLQTQSVNYIVQRTELLMGLFYLLTLYCAIRATRSAAPDRWHAAAIACCLVGAGCKESIVTVPVIVVLYDRIFLFDSMGEAWAKRRMLYAGLFASWLEVAVLMSSRSNTVGFSAGVSAWTYLLNQAQLITRYLMLTVWPRSLVLDYGVPRPLSLADVLPQAALILTLLAATGVALTRGRRWPMLGFLGAWSFIALAPTSSFIPIASEVGAERRMYIPLIPLVVLAVLAGWSLLRRRPLAMFARLAVVVIAAGLAWQTVHRNREYRSAVSVLQTVVDRWPHGRAHLNLAVALKVEGRNEKAIAHLRQAVPDDPEALYLIGSDLCDRGQFVEAVAELQAFIGRNPSHIVDLLSARNLMGLALAQQEKYGEAVEQFQLALRVEAANPDLHGNLAFVLLQQKDFSGAIEHYEAYLKIRPSNPFVTSNLAQARAGLAAANAAKQTER